MRGVGVGGVVLCSGDVGCGDVGGVDCDGVVIVWLGHIGVELTCTESPGGPTCDTPY